MRRVKRCAFVLGLALSLPLASQELETNTPGGSLTRSGANPAPGSPFIVTPMSSIDLRFGGAAGAPYVFCLGALATQSWQIGALGNQAIDLDLATVVVIGDAIGFTGFMPPAFCVIGAGGQSNWSFPANAAQGYATYSFQGAVTDPTLPPFNLNLTAAASFFVDPAVQIGSIAGDDVSGIVTTSHAYMLYGQARTQFSYTSNGFVRVGLPASNDLLESSAKMKGGAPSGFAPAPLIALVWEDLNMGGVGGSVSVFEDAGAGRLSFRWLNGQYYPTSANWGTASIEIADLGGPCQVELDYSQFAPQMPIPVEGIAGISDGDTGIPSGPDVETDIVQIGAVAPYSSTTDYTTYFQNFDGSGGAGTPAPEGFDLGGHTITLIDLTGFGQWVIF